MNLRHKTLLFVTPLIIIPIMMIGTVAFYKLKQTTEERLNTQIVTLLDQISQYVNNNVEVAEANLHILADHQLVQKYALTSDESVRYEILLPHLLTVFQNLQNSIKDYYEVRFILPDGYEDANWLANDIINRDDNISKADYFVDMKKSEDEIFKRIIYDENTQKYALLISHKLSLWDPAVDSYGALPTLRGFMVLTVSLDYIKNEVLKNTIGKTGFLSVVNPEYQIIFSPDNVKSDLSQLLLKESINTNLFAAFNNSLPGQVILKDQSFLVHSRNLAVDLKLLGILPEKEIFDSSEELGKVILVISLVTILITMIAVFYALRFLILRPLSTLNEAAQSIGKGQLNLDIKIKSNDEIGSLANSFMEMSKSLKQTHEEVSYTANHDALTGLPNRSMFQQHLSKTLAIARQKDQKLALLFIDLDDFKQVNDTLGHHAGDILLQEISYRLSRTLRKEDTKNDKISHPSDLVARLGGDEFIILLNNVDGPFNATAVAERALKKLKDPVIIFDNPIYANCSIGITLFPDDAKNSSDLIKYADIAMYHAKEQGKNHYQFYSQQLNTDMQQRLQMNAALRVALDQSLFYLHYQPKVDAKTNQITGFEALLRWHDAELGQVAPDVFISIAEESGLITPITEWVFDKVCEQCMTWKNAGLEPLPVAVNVSSIQFQRRDLVSMINNSLDKSGLTSEYIEVELTETALLADTIDAVEVLNGLNALHIKIALDDFGTGYSSLSYLNRLPIHTLKIDRSFITNITEIDQEHPIVDAIIALAHALDLQVVAEGVETIIQLEYLKNRHCDVIQGYLFSKPLPVDEVTQLLKPDYLFNIG